MNQCKIVVYHYVRNIKNSKYQINGMEIEDFKKQVDFLKKKYNPIKVVDIINAIDEKKDIPENSILFTFDDGLKDHFKNVFPILKNNNIEGVFFPSGKPIMEEIVLDVHKIHFILASTNKITLVIEKIKEFLEHVKDKHGLEDFTYYYKKFAISNRFNSKEENFIKKMLQKELPEEVRNKLVNQLFKKFVTNDEQKFSKQLYLSMNEIDEMRESGMVFGSHSYTHYWMSTLGQKKLLEEMEKNETFVDKISSENRLMCYPYGSYNKSVIQKLVEYDYKLGLTTETGDAILDTENRFTLKRFDCNDFPPISSKKNDLH